MKKSIFIFVMIILCILTSCEKEDTPIKTKTSLLSPPQLILPINNEERFFLEGLKLEWTPSVSEEKEAITYRVTIRYTSSTYLDEKFDVGEETSFIFSQELARKIKELNAPIAGNQVEVRVTWSVEAIDSKGNVSKSDTFFFNVVF